LRQIITRLHVPFTFWVICVFFSLLLCEPSFCRSFVDYHFLILLVLIFLTVKTGFSCWLLMFAIFRMLQLIWINYNIFIFFSYSITCNQQVKQYGHRYETWYFFTTQVVTLVWRSLVVTSDLTALQGKIWHGHWC